MREEYGTITTRYPITISKDEKSIEDCTSFVINSPQYGIIIFDTGSFFERQSFIDQLFEKYQIHPDKVNWIFNTHLHFDHYGNNQIFKNAKIIISRNEMKFFDEISKMLKEISDQDSLLSKIKQMIPGYSQFDIKIIDKLKNYFNNFWKMSLLGDPIYFIEDHPAIPDMINIFPSPGHTLNHYAYHVSLGKINIYVVGDALSKKSILEKPIGENDQFGLQMNYEYYYKTLEKIKKKNGLIIPGHALPFMLEN